MGFMDKLQFWKKDDDFSDLGLGKDMDFGSDMGMDTLDANNQSSNDVEHFSDTGPSDGLGENPNLGSSNVNGMNMGRSSQAAPVYAARDTPAESPMAFQQQQPLQQSYQSQISSGSPDLQLVSAKLDAIKAYLDTINQRLTNIENAIRGHNERRW